MWNVIYSNGFWHWRLVNAAFHVLRIIKNLPSQIQCDWWYKHTVSSFDFCFGHCRASIVTVSRRCHASHQCRMLNVMLEILKFRRLSSMVSDHCFEMSITFANITMLRSLKQWSRKWTNRNKITSSEKERPKNQHGTVYTDWFF